MASANAIARHQAAAAVCLTLVLAVGNFSLGTAQSLTVLPVNLQLVSGQKATTLTVTNRGETDTSIQIRAYAWNQDDGEDLLVPSDILQISPPLATIAPGARQIIRLVLRRSAGRREDSYRIILDQIPPPAEPGVVHVVLRFSIPVFALPSGRSLAHVEFHIERAATQMDLVASNDGAIHQSFHGLSLWTGAGLELKNNVSGLQYILAGATRRWPIAPEDAALLQHGGALRLSAVGSSGPFSQEVRVVSNP